MTDKIIAGLNKKFRRQNKSTDVLSFPALEKSFMSQQGFLGDIIISLDTAKCQATQGDVALRDECLFLAMHGFLHLLGHDHLKKSDFIKMNKQERRIWPLISQLPFEKMVYERH